jgi:hypothetical protein
MFERQLGVGLMEEVRLVKLKFWGEAHFPWVFEMGALVSQMQARMKE